jgi:hypothetical protein
MSDDKQDLTEYTVGPHTYQKVFLANGITDLSDMQVVLTAVERSHRKANAELVAMRRDRDDMRDLLKGIATNITKALAPAPGEVRMGKPAVPVEWVNAKDVPESWEGRSVWRYGKGWTTAECAPFIRAHFDPDSEDTFYALAVVPIAPIKSVGDPT